MTTTDFPTKAVIDMMRRKPSLVTRDDNRHCMHPTKAELGAGIFPGDKQIYLCCFCGRKMLFLRYEGEGKS